MAGINDNNRTKAVALIKEMGKEMSPGNKDGLGYAAVDTEGKLFGERWLENNEAFGVKEDMSMFGDALVGVGGEYNSFGNVDLNKIAAITLHTRLATTPKGMTNTHPFYYEEDDSSVIHNGIIDNYKDFELKVSTCDSEALLVAYLKNEVNKDISMMGEMSKSIFGYYAAGIFSRDADGNRILDVFKGNHASLIVTYILELGTYVFTTAENDIAPACKRLGLTIGKVYTVREGNLMRLDPFTSKVLNVQKFEVASRHKPLGNYNHGGYHGTQDRGSAHATSTTTPTTYTKDTAESTSNIIDVSIKGMKQKQNTLTKEMFLLKNCIPSLSELSAHEVREMGLSNQWWRSERA